MAGRAPGSLSRFEKCRLLRDAISAFTDALWDAERSHPATAAAAALADVARRPPYRSDWPVRLRVTSRPSRGFHFSAARA